MKGPVERARQPRRLWPLLLGGALAASLLVSVFPAGAQAAPADSESLEIRLETDLRRAEDLLFSGAAVTAADVARIRELELRASEEASRNVRVRSAVLAFLARELNRTQGEQALAGAAAFAVAEADRASRGAEKAQRMRRAGFWISLGFTAASTAVFGVAEYLGEAAFARYASSTTSAGSRQARLEADGYAALGIAGAAAWSAGLAATLVFGLLGGATSHP